MATQDQSLKGALDRLAEQPGVTAAQVDQVRSALLSDQDLTQRLEAAAESGALKGFAMGEAARASLPIGAYDRDSGMVTLPTSAPGDVHAVLRVQSMIVDFGKKSFTDAAGNAHPVTNDMLSNLQDTINGSPVLAEEVKRAATTDDPRQPAHRILESFDFTGPSDGVGGSFSAACHTMNLVSDSLSSSVQTRGHNGYRAGDLTFVIGHEVQHGFNSNEAFKRDASFVSSVRALASTPGPVHDYTALIEQHVQTNRDDEARAEIAAWNALRSRKQQADGFVTLETLQKAAPGRVNDFVEQKNGYLMPRAGVALNADLSMTVTPANVEAMGYNYFDRPVHLDRPAFRRHSGAGLCVTPFELYRR